MKKNNKKGFTLVELVIVVAVMAILVAVAIPTIGAVTGKARVSVYNSNAKTIESMLKLEEANADDGTGADPDYETALNDANLGIEEGTYYYVTDTNVVYTVPADGSIPESAPDGYDGTITFTDGTAALS